jgi:NTP pyrophosphatase (non-canonical NTP hydrolase)
MDLSAIQKKAMDNKIKHGWDTTDNSANVHLNFLHLYGEVAEAYDAYYKKKDDLGLELADVLLYLCGLADILGYSLEDECIKKMAINEKRVYKKINGVTVKVDPDEFSGD